MKREQATFEIREEIWAAVEANPMHVDDALDGLFAPPSVEVDLDKGERARRLDGYQSVLGDLPEPPNGVHGANLDAFEAENMPPSPVGTMFLSKSDMLLAEAIRD